MNHFALVISFYTGYPQVTWRYFCLGAVYVYVAGSDRAITHGDRGRTPLQKMRILKKPVNIIPENKKQRSNV